MYSSANFKRNVNKLVLILLEKNKQIKAMVLLYNFFCYRYLCLFLLFSVRFRDLFYFFGEMMERGVNKMKVAKKEKPFYLKNPSKNTYFYLNNNNNNNTTNKVVFTIGGPEIKILTTNLMSYRSTFIFFTEIGISFYEIGEIFFKVKCFNYAH